MDEKPDISSIFKGLDANNKPKVAEKKKTFVLHAAISGNNSEAIRQTGYTGDHAHTAGYQMSLDPEVQAAIDDLRKYSSIKITEELVTNMLMKEAATAGSSRDRREAAHLLGKTKAMFRDVQETTTHSDNSEFVAQVRKQLGDDVADTMEQELGLTG